MPPDDTKSEELRLKFEFPRPGAYSQGRSKNMLIFIVLNIITLMHAFESTGLCVILPVIAREFKASISDTFNFTTAFLLCMTLVQPFFSEISWIFGRREALSLALMLFMVGTILCGSARSTTGLVVGRAVQGAGAGATEPVKALILFDLFDLRERSKWISYMNVSWALGTIAGPLLGGTFSQNPSLTWRWIFWLNLPFLGISILGTAALLGYDKPPNRTRKLLRLIDWGGLFLFTVSGGLLLFSLSLAGSHYPWKSPQVIGTLVCGICGLPLLGLYERVATDKPIFRPSVFRQYSTTIHLLNVLLHGLLMWVLLYYMSLFYLTLKTLSPLETALWALPAIVTVAPMAMVVGYVVSKTGHYWSFLILGWCLTMASFLALGFVTLETSRATLIGISVVAGISFGALVPGMSVGIQSTVDKVDAGHAICMTLLMRPAGQALGIALGLTVFSTIFINRVMSYGFSAAESFRMMRRLAAHPVMTTFTNETVVEATMNGLRGVWIMGTAVAGLGLVLTIVAKCPRLPPDGQDEGDEEVQVGNNAGNGADGDDRDDGELFEMMPLGTQGDNQAAQDESPGHTSGTDGSDLGSRPAPIRGSATGPSGEAQPIPAPRPVVVRLGE